MKGSFAVFPKPAALIKPDKSSFHDPAFRERFDFVTSRAVAELRLLAELCLPYMKVGGMFLAMKSVESGRELEEAAPAIAALGGRVERVEDYQIPGTEVVHRVILVKKIEKTEKIYPRMFAKIKKNPL